MSAAAETRGWTLHVLRGARVKKIKRPIDPANFNANINNWYQINDSRGEFVAFVKDRQFGELLVRAVPAAQRQLLETVADIAYMSGADSYYTGDSRADMGTFIYWAEEFEKARTTDGDGNEKYFGTDYMDAIEAYTEGKLNEARLEN